MCENNRAPIRVDKERDFIQIGNAWRFYDEDDSRIYRSDLFSQFDKEHIKVDARADDKKIIARCDLVVIDDLGGAEVKVFATINVDFEADYSGVRSAFDDDRELIISVPKNVVRVSVE